MSGRVYDEPSHVAAEEGEVIVDGPDGVAVSLTPEAAAETSERLMEGAVEAHGQRIRGVSLSRPGDMMPDDDHPSPRRS